MQSSYRIRRIIRASVASAVALGTSAVVFWTPTVSTLGHSLG